MKQLSKALLVAGLVALSACGGGAEENTVANDVAADDLYNVTDDVTIDNGLGNDLGTADLGNDSGTGNSGETSNATDINATDNSQ